MNSTLAIKGSLLGTAVGDAIGLLFEGLTPRRIARFGVPPLRHRLLAGHGMFSDDTEHACMTAQSLIASAADPTAFGSDLAWRMRWWVAALPAGIGLGTLRAMVKLWLGFDAEHSGVSSAGNGPMMRAAVIGAACGGDIARMRALVRISTRITHTDPRAERAAFVVAWAAASASQSRPIDGHALTRLLPELIPLDDELEKRIHAAVDSAERGQAALSFCQDSGMAAGVPGYCYTTLQLVLQVCLRHPSDFRSAITEVVACGGDTDTGAAIAGGIIAAGTGPPGIPADWLGGIRDWPRSVAWVESVGDSLASNRHRPTRPPRLFYPFALLRNLVFMLIVLAHGLRRLLPPY